MAAASQIKEHMEVVGSDGERVGTVDHLEGDDMIKLTNTDSPDGKHHYLPVDFVDHVDDGQVHLNLTAEEAVEEWEDEDEDEEVDLEDEGVEPVSLGETAEEEDSDEWAEDRR